MVDRSTQIGIIASNAWLPTVHMDRILGWNLGMIEAQKILFDVRGANHVPPFRSQLLKWVGSKQRVAHEIIAHFPERFGRYFEPFLGSAGVLATLQPADAFASDGFAPLMEIWTTLHAYPERLISWYASRWNRLAAGEKRAEYERIKASYNQNPNGADLLFLCRACYGGVVRFRKADGYMSTPCGVHTPIHPRSFKRRVEEWSRRTAATTFAMLDYAEAMRLAKRGDMVYCDPPYFDSQRILYGAQTFSLETLFQEIADCVRRGVYVALSIDGTKRSGHRICPIAIPEGLFAREVFVGCGRSMLKRFQMGGRSLEGEVVADRLLLTY